MLALIALGFVDGSAAPAVMDTRAGISRSRLAMGRVGRMYASPPLAFISGLYEVPQFG